MHRYQLDIMFCLLNYLDGMLCQCNYLVEKKTLEKTEGAMKNTGNIVTQEMVQRRAKQKTQPRKLKR